MSASRPSTESLLHDLPLGVWVAAVPSGELIFANAAFGEIMGMSARDDVKVGGYSEPYGIFDRAGKPYPEDRMPFVRAIQARGPVTVDDIVIHRGDGRKVDIRAFARPCFDANGEMTHVIIAFTDRTAEAAALGEAALLGEQLRSALNHGPILLWTYDMDARVTMIEGRALSVLRRSAEEIVGRGVAEIYPDFPVLHDAARRSLAGETVVHAVRLDDRDWDVFVTPRRDEAGTVVGAIGVATDVTERVQMQARMAQTDRMVALGTLAAGVAHELNNPLSYVIESLIGIDDLLLLLSEDLERAGVRHAAEKRLARLREFAAHAREGAERMRVVSADLRTFSRVEDESRHAVPVSAAIDSAVHLVRRQVEARAKLVVEIPDGLCPVLANVPRLAQVVVNLLLNATQAFPSDSARDRNEIRVAARHEDGFVVIEVSDTGPGVPADVRPHVFEPFFTTKSGAEGTGLGLFVSRNIVESLGGTLSLADREGGGAVFRIRLPVAPKDAVRAPADRATPRPVPGRRPRVLLVEDDVVLGDLMRSALVSEFEVRLVRSGRDAVEVLLGEETWDLVLCDLMLGDLTGVEIHEQLAKKKPGRESWLVFMTGGAYTAAARQFLERVPNERIEKPFDVRQEVRRRLRP